MKKDRRESIYERIFGRVLIQDCGYRSPCHVWQGATSGDAPMGGGYGRMSLNGLTVAVHIVVFTHFYGYKPSNKHVDHLCNNRLCCNPEHLELVTPKENHKRRVKRSRG